MLKADYRRFQSLALAQPPDDILDTSSLRGLIHPRVAPVAWYRIAHWLHCRGLGLLGSIISFMVTMLFRVEIPARAQIGPGLVLPHPMGIVVGSASIGANVTIFQNVTLGAKQFDGFYDLTTRPSIGDGVIIGSGAVVLGSIHLGTECVVGANSLVLINVPPKCFAIGVPAEVKPLRS